MPLHTINFEMTFNALDALRGGDEQLVPILRESGMPVEFRPSGQVVYERGGKPRLIVAQNGTFDWIDNLPAQKRVFTWRGEEPLPLTTSEPAFAVGGLVGRDYRDYASSSSVSITTSSPSSSYPFAPMPNFDWPIQPREKPKPKPKPRPAKDFEVKEGIDRSITFDE